MTVLGTMVRSEVCNSGCLCLWGHIRHDTCQFFYTSAFLKCWKFTPKKRVNCDILTLNNTFWTFSFNWNYIQNFICICSLYTLSIGKTWFNLTKNWLILLQLDLKHIHKMNFYQSDNNFTQALLVTNIISWSHIQHQHQHFVIFDISWYLTFHDIWHLVTFDISWHLTFNDIWHFMRFNI